MELRTLRCGTAASMRSWQPCSRCSRSEGAAQLDRSKHLRSELEQLIEPDDRPHGPAELANTKEESSPMPSLHYVGVDVSKDTLVVACGRHRWGFRNTAAGHRKL